MENYDFKKEIRLFYKWHKDGIRFWTITCSLVAGFFAFFGNIPSV